MTDKKKQPESRRTEDLSPAELRAQIEEDKKKVSRSTVFFVRGTDRDHCDLYRVVCRQYASECDDRCDQRAGLDAV